MGGRPQRLESRVASTPVTRVSRRETRTPFSILVVVVVLRLMPPVPIAPVEEDVQERKPPPPCPNVSKPPPPMPPPPNIICIMEGIAGPNPRDMPKGADAMPPPKPPKRISSW
eukprot:scaffold13357_cov100-Isochrysis_galbana.AAC.8